MWTVSKISPGTAKVQLGVIPSGDWPMSVDATLFSLFVVVQCQLEGIGTRGCFVTTTDYSTKTPENYRSYSANHLLAEK